MLIEVSRDGHAIHIFGAGPQPPPDPFDPSAVLPILEACDELWNEVPELGDDVQALAIKYGVDPNAPLATWLTDDDLTRVDAAADATGADRALLAAMRPWLAGQFLKMAHEARSGLIGEHSAERVLSNAAARLGIPVKSEFAPPEGPFIAFSSMPRDAEIEYLRWMLDAVEAGVDAQRRIAEAWASGDLQPLVEETEGMRANYPAFHGSLIADRNVAWIARVRDMFARRSRAFLVIGTGHLVCDDGVLRLLEQAGFEVKSVGD